jgi:hypothetical protein
MIGVAAFKLQRHMLDSKSIVQFMLSLIEQKIIKFAVWFDQVRGESCLSRTHSPDVQIVHSLNARQLHQEAFHFLWLDIFGNGLKRKIHRFAQ